MLVYDGGRCGEFLTSFLHEHPGVVNNTHGFDPVTNRYFAYDTNNPHALALWHQKGIVPTLQDFGLENYNHSDTTKIVFRSHQPLPFEQLLPGLGTIITHSRNYNEFFLLLYWIKYMNRPNSKGQLKWKVAFGVDDIDQMLDQNIFVSNNMLVTPDLIDNLYHRSFYLDLDRLFFNNDLDVYFNLCDFIGIKPLDRAEAVFKEYHQKNLNLLADHGIPTESDSATTMSLREKIKRTVPRLDPLKIISHSFSSSL